MENLAPSSVAVGSLSVVSHKTGGYMYLDEYFSGIKASIFMEL